MNWILNITQVRVWWLIAILGIVAGQAGAQSLPPILHHYSAKNYSAHNLNWAAIQSPEGLLYFANNEGVLIFDGSSWELVRTPAARRLAFGPGQQILVGCVGDMGYLALDESGGYTYISLRPADATLPNFDQVLSIASKGDMVTVVTDKLILQTQFSDGKFSVLKPVVEPKGGVWGAGIVDGQVWICDSDNRILRLSGTNLEPHPASASLAAGFDRIVQLNTNQWLVAAKDKRLYRTDGNRIELWGTEADGILQRDGLFDIAAAANGQVGLGTYGGGVHILSADGRLTHSISKSNGLPDDDQYMIFADQENNFWMGHGRGLSQAVLSLPIVDYSAVEGLRGKIVDMALFNGKLYLATTQGMFYFEGGNWREYASGTFGGWEMWSVLVFKGHLFAAGANGIYDISGAAPQQLLRDATVFVLQPADKVLAYAGQNVAGVVQKTNDRWEAVNLTSSTVFSANSIALGSDGSLFVGTNYSGLYRLKPQPNGSYGVSQVTNLGLGRVNVYSIENQAIFATEEGFFVFAGNKFESFSAFEPVKHLAGRRLFSLGNQLVFTTSAGIIPARLTGGALTEDSISLLRLRQEQPTALCSDGQGGVYIAYFDQVLHFRQAQASLVASPKLLVRKIFTPDGVLLYGGVRSVEGKQQAGVSTNGGLELGYNQNTVIVRVALTDFQGGFQATQFQFNLSGEPTGWSAWQNSPDLQLANLREGSYTLRVRARNAMGQITSAELYQFTILPPWYRTWWALVLFVVLGISLIVLAVRMYLRRLVKQKELLEQTVAERTKEIADKNVEMALQNEIIAEKNEDLMDSIHYAERIQRALLPDAVPLSRHFSDAFLLLKPRDIISGDFFWYAERGNRIYVAVADCTGHGVPGALMSVMGLNLLNQIVAESSAIPAHEVLKQLDKTIRQNLHQDQKDATQQDGMDVALMVLEKASLRLEFAAAQRPLFLYRNGILTEYKGTRESIGGKYVSEFELNEIQLQPGDVLYAFSDGITDQFGGPNQKKFTPKRFVTILDEIHREPMSMQLERLEYELKAWQGDTPQTDDIVVLGLRV